MLCTIGIVAAGKSSFPTAGLLLSTYCASTSGYDASNNPYSGSWDCWGVYADGFGGSYNSAIGSNMNGCYYPYGYWYQYIYSDLQTYWMHGTYTGNFYYGYAYDGYYSDGYGGSIYYMSEYISATDGQIVNQYTANDSMSGKPTIYTLYFRLSDRSLQTTEYIVAGTFIGNSCTTLYDYPDAAGILHTVAAKQYQYADGNGGYYYTYLLNDYDCGYLPSGYYTYEMYPQTFNYGNASASIIADGMNGYTVGNSNYNYYSAGYIFYSYHDVAWAQTVNFTFDGVNGYYVAYVMD